MRSRLTRVAEFAVQIYDFLRAYRTYFGALLIFAASRLVVILGVNFGTLLAPATTTRTWDAGPAWYHRLLRWDTGWYASIIHEGYRYSDDPSVHSSTVFYPLYPLISYALKLLLGIDEHLALLIVANVASVVAVLLMTKIVVEELGDEVALLSLSLFCFFPSSLFLSAGYTESLCLVFILLGFILSTRKKFQLASVSAGLSLGTRSIGVAMIPVILWQMWDRKHPLRVLPRMALCGVLAASGLLFYMAYLGVRFGHPMAFATGQSTWQSGTFLDRLVSAATLGPFRSFNWWKGGWFVCFLVLTVWSFRQLRFPFSLYALASLMLPYLALGITDSMNRFVLMCFPAFMCGHLVQGAPMAHRCVDRHFWSPASGQYCTVLAMVLGGLNTHFFRIGKLSAPRPIRLAQRQMTCLYSGVATHTAWICRRTSLERQFRSNRR